MKVKVQFELDPKNPADRALLIYARVHNPKKIGQALHELLRRIAIEKCMGDNEWKLLYCEPVEVKVHG